MAAADVVRAALLGPAAARCDRAATLTTGPARRTVHAVQLGERRRPALRKPIARIRAVRTVGTAARKHGHLIELELIIAT